VSFDLLAAARDLIAADSVSAHGNLRALDVLERVARGFGLETYRQEAEALGAKQANLIVHPAGAPPRDGGLLLVTHTDTVGPGPRELWTETDPFALKLADDGDTLFGLGVADVKLDALAKLEALSKAPRSAHGKIAFCGTFVEEVGCRGAKHFLANRPFSPRWASCGEPSELRIIDGHKGYLVAKVTVRDAAAFAPRSPLLRLVFAGKAAHSSTPHLGESAIAKALAFCDAAGLLPVAARGGDATNKVAARCAVDVPDRPGLAERARAAGAAAETALPDGRSAARAIAAFRRVAAELARIVAGAEPLEDARFDPRTTVFNQGVIEATDGGATGFCDARLLPGHDPEAMFATLEAFAERVAREENVTIEISRERSNPAMALPATSLLRDAARAASRACGLNPEPQTKPTNTEGGVFVSRGVEAIVFGPGRSTGNAHCANERQSLAQLRAASGWYERLIANLVA
jgi:acetylornithine deacetylase/succinyl-diaminopimelate desuccinylase-like protein